MHTHGEGLEAEYFEFVSKLEEEIDELQRTFNFRAIALTYSQQLGPNAGEEIQFFAGEPKALTDPNTSVTKIPLLGTFDRPIGNLKYTPNDEGRSAEAVERMAQSICLRTYMYRNEVCGGLLSNVLRGTISSEMISKDGYALLAKKFNQVLSSSGFLIWHVCKDERIDGEYVLTDLTIGDTVIPSNFFLHVLGSSPDKENVDMPIGDGIAAFTLKSGKPLRLDNLQDEKEVARKTNGARIKHLDVVERNKWRSGVFLPLISENKVVGVIGAYSPRVSGFNNLDVMIVTRCAEQIAAHFVVHRVRQQNSRLQKNIQRVGIQLASAQYSVYGSVHDAINASSRLVNNLELVKATRETNIYYETASDHADRLKDVLGKLRSDIRSPDDIPIKVSKVNLREFFDEKLKALNVDAHTRGIKLLNKVPNDFEIETDQFRLSQSAFNIVTNSIRHFQNTNRHPKEITIRATMLAGEEKFRLEFEDNGPGIDPSNLPDRIFEPFVTTSGGMGLGLTIVKTFVEEMAGTVRATSSWGDWSLFSLTLPTKLKGKV